MRSLLVGRLVGVARCEIEGGGTARASTPGGVENEVAQWRTATFDYNMAPPVRPCARPVAQGQSRVGGMAHAARAGTMKGRTARRPRIPTAPHVKIRRATIMPSTMTSPPRRHLPRVGDARRASPIMVGTRGSALA